MVVFCITQRINEKQSVIVDYESGRAIPNQQILAKLERALGEEGDRCWVVGFIPCFVVGKVGGEGEGGISDSVSSKANPRLTCKQ